MSEQLHSDIFKQLTSESNPGENVLITNGDSIKKTEDAVILNFDFSEFEEKRLQALATCVPPIIYAVPPNGNEIVSACLEVVRLKINELIKPPDSTSSDPPGNNYITLIQDPDTLRHELKDKNEVIRYILREMLQQLD